MSKRPADLAMPTTGEKKTKTLEGTATAVVVPSDPAAEAEVYEQRMLIDSKEVGTIIGKGGANITTVRDTNKVYVSILKADYPDVTERVMTIKGEVANVCNAVKHITDLLVDAACARERKAGATDVDLATKSYQIRFLCHLSQAGAIIGKGGAIIKQTSADTQCRIQLSTDPLGPSSEKSVSLTGTIDAIYQATLRIVPALQSQPVKPGTRNTLYVPLPPQPAYGGFPPQGHGGPSYGAPPAAFVGRGPSGRAGGYGGPGAGSFGGPSRGYGGPSGPSSGPYGGRGAGGFGGAGAGAAAAGGAGGAAAAGSQQKIVIPTVCAGNVIGRSGAIISDIRQQSGTFISIAKPEATAPHERVVTISGSSQGIQHAVFLIRQVVEQYEGQIPAQY